LKKNIVNKYCRKFGFEIHGTGYMQSLLKGSFKDDAFTKQQELFGKNVSVIFDIGANRGDVVAKYLEMFPKAIIYAFEPFPDSFEILEQRFKENDSVRCFKLAIAEEEGTKSFYVNRNVDTNSLLKPKQSGLSSDKQVENLSVVTVASTTLDKFCSENNINHINILKMDIQGGELAALKGASGLLHHKQVDNIYSEVYFMEQYESQPLFHDISKYLYGFDFSLQDIYSPIYGKGNLAWGDVIFILNKNNQ
jgi:FkbM family methyltransferase